MVDYIRTSGKTLDDMTAKDYAEVGKDLFRGFQAGFAHQNKPQIPTCLSNEERRQELLDRYKE